MTHCLKLFSQSPPPPQDKAAFVWGRKLFLKYFVDVVGIRVRQSRLKGDLGIQIEKDRARGRERRDEKNETKIDLDTHFCNKTFYLH